MQADKLLRLVQRCGVQGIRDRGTDIQGLCPYHEETSPSWGISKREPHLFGCFACNAKGSVVKLLVDKMNVSYTMAEQMAEVKATVRQARDLILDAYEPEEDDSMSAFFDTYVPAKEAYRYMLRRGVSVASSKTAGIRYDFDKQRVLFPWRIGNRLYGFTGRAIDPEEEVKTLPYENPTTEKTLAKGDCLYVPDQKFRPKDSRLVLVEGEIDAIKVMQDVTNVVAAVGFGKFTVRQQQLVMSWSPSEVTTFFDDDETGQHLTNIVKRTIGTKLRVTSADYELFRGQYPDTKLDPAELRPEDRRLILKRPRSDLSL